MSIVLDLQGYTNANVVRCIYDKSPLEFYANINAESVLDNQLEILRLAWPDINKLVFLKDVCSSSLEKRVWINRQQLIPSHAIKLQITKINTDDIISTLGRSMGEKIISDNNLNNIPSIIRFLTDKIIYPTCKIDFIPLILEKCNPHTIGLKQNVIYYLSKPPLINNI